LTVRPCEWHRRTYNQLLFRKETNVKKTKKPVIKKITLRDLDEPSIQKIAGGYSQAEPTCPAVCPATIETGHPVCCS